MRCSIVLLWPILASFITPFVFAVASIEDAFYLKTGNSAGSCDQYRRGTGTGQLDDIWDEIQRMNNNAVESLKTDTYNGNPDIRKLAKSLFGIAEDENTGEVPTQGMGLEQLTKARTWFDGMGEILSGHYATTNPDRKAWLYCDSNALEYQEETSPARDISGNIIRTPNGRARLMREEYRSEIKTTYFWWVPEQNAYVTGSRKAIPQLYASYPNENNPTFCAADGHYGLSIHDDDILKHPIILLCPQSFRKPGYAPRIDLSVQKTGTVLNSMQTLSITLYHEMFHYRFPPFDDGISRHLTNQSPDAPLYVAKRENKKKVPHRDWPRTKNSFKALKKEDAGTTEGAIACMYLALRDQATKVATNIQDIEATKNPETYAWFGLANFLLTEGHDHQDWSTGACRPKGSPPHSVTVSTSVFPRHEATISPAAF